MPSELFGRSINARRGFSPVDNRSHSSRLNVPYLIRNGLPTLFALGLAGMAGILLGLGLLSFDHHPGNEFQRPGLRTFDHGRFNYHDPDLGTTKESTQPIINHESPSLSDLQDMVSRTNGYYARDYSLNLGWNNMRYIIESALLHGMLLDRTVILPSFVFARSCEHHVNVCARYLPMVNHGDAVQSNEWRHLSIEEQLSWRVPISNMLNLTLLRATQPVITIAEYLQLHNIPLDAEAWDGKWDPSAYHLNRGKFTDKIPSVHVLKNSDYDPLKVNRVDSIPFPMKQRGAWVRGSGEWPKNIKKSKVYIALEAALPEKPYVLSWELARAILEHMDHHQEIESDQSMEVFLNENGWEVLYTYNGALGMDYIKNVVNPIRQVAPRDSIRGLREDYGSLATDVVYLPGEIHYERKPGGLRFTTTENRDVFSQLVFYHVRAPNKVYDLATKLASRMKMVNDGRMWLGAHMRRGDFIRTNWVMESTLEGHLDRIKSSLATGRATLRSMQGTELTTYSVPDTVPDHSIAYMQPPEESDKFYLATDERDPGNVAYLKDHGAVLVGDLLTFEDRQEFGWELMFTDILGLVEQAALAQASYFYAHAMSSYAGGTINMRAASGLDPRTALID